MAGATLRSSAKRSSAPSSTICARTKWRAGRGRRGPFVYLLLRSDAVDVVYGTMDGYAALGIPYMPHIAPTQEVVTWRTKKSTSSSSGQAPRARFLPPCWRKRARRLWCWSRGRTGSSSDLISSDFWGRRIKPASGPFLLEGKNPFGYVYQAGWGVGGAALHYFANFPRLLPNDFKIKSEHGRALDWPISYSDVAPYYDKVAQDVGVSGDAKAEEFWRPAGAALSHAADENLPQRRGMAQRLRGRRHPAWCRRPSE